MIRSAEWQGSRMASEVFLHTWWADAGAALEQSLNLVGAWGSSAALSALVRSGLATQNYKIIFEFGTLWIL